jgi:PhnB protein
MANVKPIPEGYHTITPSLVPKDAARAIDFYKRAFGATESGRMQTPDGKIAHAELKIGDSRIMISDEFPQSRAKSPQTIGGTTSALFMYVQDVDAAYQRALGAGATVVMPVADMFWGDRYGQVADPFGYVWGLATHKEDVSETEMKRRAEDMFKKMAAG